MQGQGSRRDAHVYCDSGQLNAFSDASHQSCISTLICVSRLVQYTSDNISGFITRSQFCDHELHSHSCAAPAPGSSARPGQSGMSACALGESGERSPRCSVRPDSIGVLRMSERRSESRVGQFGKPVSRLCGRGKASDDVVESTSFRSTSSCEASCSALRKTNPFTPSLTNSSKLHTLQFGVTTQISMTDAHHAKSRAHTGNPHPNMSTTFIGRSSAEELECREMPMSAEPVNAYHESEFHITSQTEVIPSMIG